MKDPISKWANDAQKAQKNRKKEKVLVTTDFADQGFDAIHELYEVNKYIETRLEELRGDIESYVAEHYDPIILARYDELTKIKHFINKLNQ